MTIHFLQAKEVHHKWWWR